MNQQGVQYKLPLKQFCLVVPEIDIMYKGFAQVHNIWALASQNL